MTPTPTYTIHVIGGLVLAFSAAALVRGSWADVAGLALVVGGGLVYRALELRARATVTDVAVAGLEARVVELEKLKARISNRG